MSTKVAAKDLWLLVLYLSYEDLYCFYFDTVINLLIREHPFNLKGGGGYGFLGEKFLSAKLM